MDGCGEIWILSISSRNRLMFCLLCGLIQTDKNTHKDDM
jgi:hypothetical protein